MTDLRESGTRASDPATGTSGTATRASGLTVSDLTIRYGDTEAVRGVSMEVLPDEAVAVVGPSGCGKSSTLRAVAGLTPVAGGGIGLGGRDITHLDPARRGVGLVPQNYAVFPHLSVAGNIAYGLRARRIPADRRRRRVAEMLELTQLTELAGRRPDQLSGGQRQRVALARALAVEPDVLLLDEPLAALDPQLRGGLRRELSAMLSSSGCATLIVTHDQREALSLGSRIALMREGSLVQFGTPRELWEDPADAFVADFLANAVLLDAEPSQGEAAVLGGRWRIPVADLRTGPTRHGRTRLLLRDDSLTVTDRDDARAVTAQVTHAEFVGDAVRLTVDAHGHVFGVRVPPDARIGGSVSLAVVPGRAALLVPAT